MMILLESSPSLQDNKSSLFLVRKSISNAEKDLEITISSSNILDPFKDCLLPKLFDIAAEAYLDSGSLSQLLFDLKKIAN